MDCATGIHGSRAAGWRLWQVFAAAIVLSLCATVTVAAGAPVVVVQLQGAIGPASADYLVGGIRKAADGGAPLVVIQLDTPGGLDTSMREAVSLTAGEALQARVVDVIARDLTDLLAQIDGRGVRLQSAQRTLATRGAQYAVRLPDWRQRALAVIAHPSVALILMMIGIYGLLFEFAVPGHGVAGVTGTICLLLALFALQLLPVNYAAVALIVLGIALLIAELLTPTFGVLGAGGVAAIVAGGILLFDSDSPGFGVPLPLVLGLAVASAVIVLAGGGMALKARRRPVVSGRENLPGTTGEVLEVNPGEIWAEVLGERWKVVSTQPLAPGQRIRVLRLRGLTLQVQAEPQSDPKESLTS